MASATRVGNVQLGHGAELVLESECSAKQLRALWPWLRFGLGQLQAWLIGVGIPQATLVLQSDRRLDLGCG